MGEKWVDTIAGLFTISLNERSRTSPTKNNLLSCHKLNQTKLISLFEVFACLKQVNPNSRAVKFFERNVGVCHRRRLPDQRKGKTGLAREVSNQKKKRRKEIDMDRKRKEKRVCKIGAEWFYMFRSASSDMSLHVTYCRHSDPEWSRDDRLNQLETRKV